MTELLQQAGISEAQVVLDIGFGSVEELVAIGALVGQRGRVIGLEKPPEIDFQPIPRVKFMLYKIAATLSRRKLCEDRHGGFSCEEMVKLLSPYRLDVDYRVLDEMGRLGWLEVPLFLARATKKQDKP